MDRIRKQYITNPDFEPAKVGNASQAAKGLCQWVLAMDKYDVVAKVVAPKRAALKAAEAKLKMAMDSLNEKRAKLAEVQKKLENLQTEFTQTVNKKKRLEAEVSMCELKLQR